MASFRPLTILNKFKRFHTKYIVWSQFNYTSIKISGKSPNICKLSKLLNNPCVKEIKKENRKYLEYIEDKNTTYENAWDITKAIRRQKFIGLKAYILREKVFQIKKLEIN